MTAVGAVLIGVVLGLLDTVTVASDRTTEPRWTVTLAPLRAAPLERNEVVALLLPRSVAVEQATVLLFEAAWLRPGVRWVLASDPEAAAAGAFVTVAGAPHPPGWQEAWRRAELVLWRRATP